MSSYCFSCWEVIRLFFFSSSFYLLLLSLHGLCSVVFGCFARAFETVSSRCCNKLRGSKTRRRPNPLLFFFFFRCLVTQLLFKKTEKILVVVGLPGTGCVVYVRWMLFILPRINLQWPAGNERGSKKKRLLLYHLRVNYSRADGRVRTNYRLIDSLVISSSSSSSCYTSNIRKRQ